MQYFRNHPFLPATVFFIVTVVLLTLPGSSFPKSHLFDIPYFDKWVHIGLFGLLCLLFSFPIRDFSISNSKKRNWFLLITAIGIGYGISMEFVQKYWIPNRSFELMDIVADSVGCLLALIFSLLRLRMHKQA
jgi:VanZ family protein